MLTRIIPALVFLSLVSPSLLEAAGQGDVAAAASAVAQSTANERQRDKNSQAQADSEKKAANTNAAAAGGVDQSRQAESGHAQQMGAADAAGAVSDAAADDELLAADAAQRKAADDAAKAEASRAGAKGTPDAPSVHDYTNIGKVLGIKSNPIRDYYAKKFSDGKIPIPLDPIPGGDIIDPFAQMMKAAIWPISMAIGFFVAMVLALKNFAELYSNRNYKGAAQTFILFCFSCCMIQAIPAIMMQGLSVANEFAQSIAVTFHEKVLTKFESERDVAGMSYARRDKLHTLMVKYADPRRNMGGGRTSAVVSDLSCGLNLLFTRSQSVISMHRKLTNFANAKEDVTMDGPTRGVVEMNLNRIAQSPGGAKLLKEHYDEVEKGRQAIYDAYQDLCAAYDTFSDDAVQKADKKVAAAQDNLTTYLNRNELLAGVGSPSWVQSAVNHFFDATLPSLVSASKLALAPGVAAGAPIILDLLVALSQAVAYGITSLAVMVFLLYVAVSPVHAALIVGPDFSGITKFLGVLQEILWIFAFLIGMWIACSIATYHALILEFSPDVLEANNPANLWTYGFFAVLGPITLPFIMTRIMAPKAGIGGTTMIAVNRIGDAIKVTGEALKVAAKVAMAAA